VVIAAITLVAALVAECPSVADLAATYYQGDGTGVNWSLELRQDGTFAFSWEGCLGNYDRQAGRWSLARELIELEVLERKPDPPGNSLPTSFWPIRWGGRVYLAAADELAEFCNFVNDGTEPRREAQGSVFLRENDWDLAVSGKPDVPQEMRSHLLARPVRGRIVRHVTTTSAVVNRGARDGLQPGMILYLQGSDFISYRVVSTSSATCRVETVYGETVQDGPVSTLLYDARLRPECTPR
jgi:hypothetical protein